MCNEYGNGCDHCNWRWERNGKFCITVGPVMHRPHSQSLPTATTRCDHHGDFFCRRGNPRGDHSGEIWGQSDNLSLIHCYYNYIHRSIVDMLAVAAVLQYFVTLVTCRMLLTWKKHRRKYWVKLWLTTRTVHVAYHSLFNDLLITDSMTFKNFMWMDFPAFEDLLSRTEARITNLYQNSACLTFCLGDLWRKQWHCIGGVADPRELLSD